MVSKGSEYKNCIGCCTFLSAIYYKFSSHKALKKTELHYAKC